jgi:hypothetical protein
MLADKELHLILLRLDTRPPQLAAFLILVNGIEFAVKANDFTVGFTKKFIVIDHGEHSDWGMGEEWTSETVKRKRP